jgi:hypothetical protein
MNKYLAKKPTARSLPERQRQIDGFVTYYNEHRSHHCIGRRIPTEVFDAKIKAHPATDGHTALPHPR